MSIVEVIPENENERLRAVLSLEILDTAIEEEFERINELAAILTGSEICLISFIDQHRQWFKSKIGMETTFTPRKLSFCQYTILKNELLEVTDTLEDERFKNSQFVQGAPYIRFYAGQPIVDENGFALGTICVFGSTVRKLNQNQLRGLKLLADECMLLLKNRLDKKEITYTKEILERCNKVAKIGTWELDMATKSMYWSKLTREIHGVDLNFKPDWDNGTEFIASESARKEFKDLMDHAIADKNSFDQNFRIQTLQGHNRWIRVTGIPYYIDGACRKIFGTYQDISENKNLEISLQKAKEIAEAGSKLKSEFLANMSHEIRTPLNGVIGFIDLLLRTPLEDYQEDYMRIVSESANHLMDLINDILDFSKIEAGKLDLHPEVVDLDAFWKQAQDIVSYKAKEKGLDFSVDLSPKIPKFLFFDSLRLKQVLINLLSNAIKFTESGRILLQVKDLPTTNDNYFTMEISIIDSGIGIPLEKQSIIMEAFSQADYSTTRKYGGTGLGLTISNSILSMMESKLEIESEEKLGSRFYFKVSFPISGGTKNESVQKAESDYEFRPLKILIAEDNDLNLLLTKTFLNKINKNFYIISAKNGEEAWEKFQEQDFDLILMDIQMPKMNGLEATKLIRSHEKGTILIIALTAGTYSEELVACKESGMDDILSKPIVLNSLKEMLAKYN